MNYNSFIAFLAITTYIATLIPANLGKVFLQTKKWQINKLFLKKRRLLGLTAFSLSCSHCLISINKYNINLLNWKTYGIYYTGFISFSIFFVLAITSNKWCMHKLKHKWKMLHQLTYVAMFLLILHIFSLMKENWTWITPVALQLILSVSFLFVVRLFITIKKMIAKRVLD